jgi:hypothetical protein
VTAATNKVEAFNGFSQWIGFGNGGVLTDNDTVEQDTNSALSPRPTTRTSTSTSPRSAARHLKPSASGRPPDLGDLRCAVPGAQDP